jgi:hypothetical protein
MPKAPLGYNRLDRGVEGTRALSRRRWMLTAVGLTGVTVCRLGVSAPAGDAPTVSDAVGVLERERSAAEGRAVILASVGRKDVNRYIRGIQLYADAKAEFDGLIAQLRFDLINGSDPAQSPQFAAALHSAAEKRIAFTDFVDDQVVGNVEGARPGLPDVVKVVPDLVKAITDAGLAIWDAFHKANKERREAILNEIDHLRWRAFADLAPKPGN